MHDLHQTQRAMRQLREAAVQRGVVAVLDIGTHEMRCLVLRFDGSDPHATGDDIGAMAGQSRFRVIGANSTRSRGLRFGDIDAMPESERAIRTVVQAAQKMAQVRVDHVIACFSGGDIRPYGLAGALDLNGREVDELEVARVLSACDMPDIGEDRDVLHAHPVNFTLDHRTGLGDPRGQTGNRLEVDMTLLSVEARSIRNLIYAIKRCDLELAGIASSAYAAGLAALVEDERELGAVCVDLGGGTTGLSMFYKKHMIFADCVRLGADHITSDIAQALRISPAFAERIKTMEGGVLATGMDHRHLISVDDPAAAERGRDPVRRSELIGIIEPRVAEILEDVREKLDAAGFDKLPNQQIVLTGGGSQLPGIDGMAARILGAHIRLGQPLRVRGLPHSCTAPKFSAAVGLALFAAHPQDEWWDFDMPADRLPARSVRRALRWVKDNW